jgi:hypothetical protein
MGCILPFANQKSAFMEGLANAISLVDVAQLTKQMPTRMLQTIQMYNSWHFLFGFALRCVALLCGLCVQLHLVLSPAGGPFLASLSVKIYNSWHDGRMDSKGPMQQGMGKGRHSN